MPDRWLPTIGTAADLGGGGSVVFPHGAILEDVAQVQARVGSICGNAAYRAEGPAPWAGGSA